MTGEIVEGQRSGSLEDRVSAARLTPAQRQVSRLLLESSERLVFLSAAELAAEASVSQPSVSRLARALGYADYGDMLEAVRARALALSAEREKGGPKDINPHQQFILDEIALLQNLSRRLEDPSGLNKAADILASADQVVILGLRISAALGRSFAYRLGRMRPGIRLITFDGTESYDELTLAASAGHSALVVFAMPRYPKAVPELMSFAKAKGYSVVVVTDSHASPFVSVSDVALVAEINWTVTFGTHTAAISLSALLAEQVAMRRQRDTRHRLGNLDEVASSKEYYLLD